MVIRANSLMGIKRTGILVGRPMGMKSPFCPTASDEKQEQLYIIPFRGGEARPLTELKGSFASFEWSPDGATDRLPVSPEG